MTDFNCKGFNSCVASGKVYAFYVGCVPNLRVVSIEPKTKTGKIAKQRPNHYQVELATTLHGPSEQTVFLSLEQIPMTIKLYMQVETWWP